jgi:hypothetical protein
MHKSVIQYKPKIIETKVGTGENVYIDNYDYLSTYSIDTKQFLEEERLRLCYSLSGTLEFYNSISKSLQQYAPMSKSLPWYAGDYMYYIDLDEAMYNMSTYRIHKKHTSNGYIEMPLANENTEKIFSFTDIVSFYSQYGTNKSIHEFTTTIKKQYEIGNRNTISNIYPSANGEYIAVGFTVPNEKMYVII